MNKPKIEKFSLRTIAEAVSRSDTKTARDALLFAIGSPVDVVGKVQKLVRRDEQCKLVVEPADVQKLTVFADCLKDAERIKARKMRKGSPVSLRGKLQSFGAIGVCLSDCCLVGEIGNL